MKDDILFINEAFYKRYTPVTRSIDDAQLTSLARSTQVTRVIDLLSDKLYDHFYDALDNNTAFTPDEADLFVQVQLFIVHVVSERFLTESPLNAGNEAVDRAIKSIHSSTIQLDSKINKMINASEELSAIATSSTIVEYDGTEMGNQGGFEFV